MNTLARLPKIKKAASKRKGRGLSSGKGHGAGRGGNRRQKSKEKIPLFFEGGQGRLVKKYPLLRGKGKNKSVRKTVAISLDILNMFASNEKIDKQALVKKGILKKSDKGFKIKVLATGKIDKKVVVQLPVSAGAKKKIEQAGGKVE